MSDLEKQVTLLTPHGYSSGTCGYCSEPGQRSPGSSSKKFGMIAPQMTCQFYQDMINRGWRRSGTFMYRPDNPRSCCPQLTIRLSVLNFKPSKKHRQVVNRWNRFLATGHRPGDPESSAAADQSGQTAGKSGRGKGKGPAITSDFWGNLQEREVGWGTEGRHRYETELVPAQATPETFELYKRYQIAVHRDDPDRLSMRSFANFLCESPLIELPIPYAAGTDTSRLPRSYGSHHLLYRVDSQLVGISVIDILPSCISSVYFIWDPDWAWASLGKLSALREAALAKRMNDAGVSGMQWTYMGFWIARCQKMRYKGEYSPSYLLDVRSGDFHELTPKLDAYLSERPGHRPFPSSDKARSHEDQAGTDQQLGMDVEEDYETDDSNDSDEEALFAYPLPPPEGLGDPATIPEDDVDHALVLLRHRGSRSDTHIVRLQDLRFNNSRAVKRKTRELLAAVGKQRFAIFTGKQLSLEDQAILCFD